MCERCFVSRKRAQVNRKIALLGDRGVGKTSLAAFFVEGRFQERYDPTIEVTYHKKINFKRMTFLTDIVDTAGMVKQSSNERLGTVPLWKQVPDGMGSWLCCLRL